MFCFCTQVAKYSTRRLFQGILKGRFRGCSRPFRGYLEVILKVFQDRLKRKTDKNLQPKKLEKILYFLIKTILTT